MSLFIGALAFPDQPALNDATKIGVLPGSLASALAGLLILRFAPRDTLPTRSRQHVVDAHVPPIGTRRR